MHIHSVSEIIIVQIQNNEITKSEPVRKWSILRHSVKNYIGCIC